MRFFSPVVKFKTIRMMFAIVAHYDLELEQLDVKTAFLHGDLDEKIYMKQPAGFIDSHHPNYVSLLKRFLYGLKQSPRQWYKCFDTFVMNVGFNRSKYDCCFYFMLYDSIPVYLLLYVDDMLLISNSKSKICELKMVLNTEFDMKDLGNAKRILGMVIERDREHNMLKVHQSSYLHKAVSKFGVLNSKMVAVPLAGLFVLSKLQCPVNESEFLQMEEIPYANAIGIVMFSLISTRPDLAYSISLLSRFMSNPRKEHWNALKHLLRYLNSTLHVGLCYKKRFNTLGLVGYVDSNFAGDKDSRKTTTAYFFTLIGNCIS